MTDHLVVMSERTGTTARITASGEIDIATAAVLREQLASHLNHAEIVVLDLTAILFIDSSGLHALLDAADQSYSRLRMIPSPVCLRLFEIAGVLDRLPLIDNNAQPALHSHTASG